MAGGSALKPVQQALFGLFSADATLLALLGGAAPPAGDPKIYDKPPKNQPYPYVLVGDGDELKWDTMGPNGSGKIVRPRVVGWTRACDGFLQVEDIINRVIQLADDVAFAVAGFTLVHCTHDATRTGRIDDGVTRWAMAEFTLNLRQV